MFDLFPGYNETPMTELAMWLPMYSHGAAYALDWNDDGVLDLWHHNHYKFSGAESRWSDPSTERKGPEIEPGGCMVDWDAVLRNGTTGTYYAPNNGSGFIEWNDANTDESCFDTHSTSFIDIDGDGYKDLFIVTGGGKGLGNSYVYDNLLFWGEPTNSSLGFRLVGGRDAARAAKLDGRRWLGNERGRHHYWLDVDGDNLLDLIFLNDERNDDAVVPGNLYRNMSSKRRRFQRVRPGGSGFAEFASIALLTDVDGDGFARELVVPSDCEPRTTSSGLPHNSICDRSPRGSVSIYRYDSQHMLVRESVTPSFANNEKYLAIASGDFDSDGLADIAILWDKKVHFHHSTSLQKRCQDSSEEERQKCLLTLGPPNVELNLKNCKGRGAVLFRFADFNLDGRIDMLVVCKFAGMHTIYELTANNKWKEMLNTDGLPLDLGDLNSPDLMLGGPHFCDGVPVTSKRSQTCEAIFGAEQCKDVRYRHQYLVCSMRAKKPDKPGASAHGVTVADIDNDGNQDVILSYWHGSMLMFRNTFGDNVQNRFFAVRLDRTAGAARSIGAIVKLTASRMGPYANETTTQVRVLSTLNHETDPEGGHDDRLIFGLGDRGRTKKLIVQWPHCCKETMIFPKVGKFRNYYNSMMTPYEVPAPNNCHSSCFATS